MFEVDKNDFINTASNIKKHEFRASVNSCLRRNSFFYCCMFCCSALLGAIFFNFSFVHASSDRQISYDSLSGSEIVSKKNYKDTLLESVDRVYFGMASHIHGLSNLIEPSSLLAQADTGIFFFDNFARTVYRSVNDVGCYFFCDTRSEGTNSFTPQQKDLPHAQEDDTLRNVRQEQVKSESQYTIVKTERVIERITEPAFLSLGAITREEFETRLRVLKNDIDGIPRYADPPTSRGGSVVYRDSGANNYGLNGDRITISGDLLLGGALYDMTNAKGVLGYVLQSTGSGTTWVATSSLGLSGSGSGESLFTDDGSYVYPTSGDSVHAPTLTATSTTGTSTFEGGLVAGNGSFNVLQNGRIGIGNTSPASLFHLTSDTVLSGKVIGSFAGLGGKFDFDLRRARGNHAGLAAVAEDDVIGAINFSPYDGSSYRFSALIRADIDGTVATDDVPTRMMFYTSPSGQANGLERLRITSAGNIGIGTTSPYAKLSVAGETVAEKFTATSTTATSTFAGGLTIDGSSLVVDYSTGFVGLGTSAPTDQLTLKSNNSGGRFITLDRTAFPTISNTFSLGITEINGTDSMFFGVGSNKNMYLDESGFIGMGTGEPSYQLHVSRSDDGNVAGFTDTNGTCTINPTSTALSCSSDRTLKKDIYSLDPVSMLNKVALLNAVNYHWKTEDSDSPLRIGFIAQEVEKIFPEFVTTGPNGKKAVSYGSFTPVLTSAIQAMYKDVYTMDLANINNEDTFVGRLLGFFKDMGITITDGLATIKNLVANKLTVGTSEKPTGITLYDEVTGNPYCFVIRNGQPTTYAGECGVATQTAAASNFLGGSSTSGNDGGIEESGNPEHQTEVATSTEDVVEEASAGNAGEEGTDDSQTEENESGESVTESAEAGSTSVDQGQIPEQGEEEASSDPEVSQSQEVGSSSGSSETEAPVEEETI